jgi:DNA-directed RNA polymerase specialized sigma24 family protein
MGDYAEFFATSRHDVFRAVLAATAHHAGAEDAVAEAYARGYASWPSLQHHPNPTAWVIRTALNAHRSTWRRLRRELVGLVAPDRGWVPAEVGVDPRVAHAVRTLPRRQREVVALRLLADLDARATGEVLGIAAATVDVHLHRALARLRRDLGPPPDRTGLSVSGPAPVDRGPGQGQLDVLEMGWIRYAY